MIETMGLPTFIALMNEDLRREYHHMHFYLRSATAVQGLHRAEIGEYLLEEAASEMKHCEEFSRKIIGLGGVPDQISSLDVPHLTDAREIISYALDMEQKVVDQFARRLEQADTLPAPYNAIMRIFYEAQMEDSSDAVFDLTEMMRGK
jgi:bacterioferritin (cytochrome b1)